MHLYYYEKLDQSGECGLDYKKLVHTVEILKKISRLPVAPISEKDINELSNILQRSVTEFATDEQILIKSLCAHLLDQIRRDKAPSFSTIKESQIALEKISIGLAKKNPQSSVYPKLSIKPRYYQFETLASCNAACSFCPYTTMARKGARMSDETIDNLISQISKRDHRDLFDVCIHKVSEPLLDSRLISIMNKVLESHPRATFSITSNLNFVPQDFWKELLLVVEKYGNRVALSISLNESNAKRYSELMKMSQERTLQNMKELHEICDQYFSYGLKSIFVTRISTQGMHDYEFLEFVRHNFPKFTPDLFKLNSWVEKDNDVINDHTQLIFGDRSCKEWSRLSINAEGFASLCCMDSESVKSIGNVYSHSLDEMYKMKCQQFSPASLKRKDSILPCSSCNYPSTLPIIS